MPRLRRLLLRGCAPALVLCGLGAASGPVPLRAQSSAPTRWILVYAGGPGRPAYSVDDYVHLVSVTDTLQRPTSWLATGVIYLEIWASSGHAFFPDYSRQWADGHDWSVYLDTLFAPGAQLDRLDSAVSVVAARAGPLGHPFPVAVMIPYPDTRLDSIRFGAQTYRLGGPSPAGRVGLARAWVDSVEARFQARHYHGIALHGMYWEQEQAAAPDREVIPQVATAVHQAGLSLLWIPYYHAVGYDAWRRLGFDEAWYQPNFFFHPEIHPARLDSAMRAADSLAMGIEIEFDPRLFTNPAYADRLEPYLATLRLHPELRRRSIAIYDGAGALLTLSRSRDARLRALYDDFVAAVAGSEGPPRR